MPRINRPGVETGESYVGCWSVSVRRDEQAAQASGCPENILCARRAVNSDNVTTTFICAKGSACQSICTQRLPVATGLLEIARLLVSVLVEISLGPTTIRRTPHMLKAYEHRAADQWIGN